MASHRQLGLLQQTGLVVGGCLMWQQVVMAINIALLHLLVRENRYKIIIIHYVHHFMDNKPGLYGNPEAVASNLLEL